MKLVWTKSDLPLSRAIRWIFREDCSHFAFLFDDDHRLVFHSNLIGAHVEWADLFFEKCEVVHSLELDISDEEQEYIYSQLPEIQKWGGYDFGGLLYFAWRGLLKFFFNVPLPENNAWSSDSKYLCTKMARLFENHLKSEGVDLSMTTPDKLFRLFSGDK